MKKWGRSSRRSKGEHGTLSTSPSPDLTRVARKAERCGIRCFSPSRLPAELIEEIQDLGKEGKVLGWALGQPEPSGPPSVTRH